MKSFKIISRIGAVSYIILGLVTIGSIFNGTMDLYINLIMGVLIMATGYYLYAKANSIIALLTTIGDSTSDRQATSNTVTRFLLFETIFAVASLLLGGILLSGAVSRVFLEKMPVFG